MRDLEAVEVEELPVGGDGGVPAVEAELGLVEVGGGGDVVDGDVIGGDETGEMEELVEVTLGGERDHHHRHPGRSMRRLRQLPGVDGVWVVGRGSHIILSRMKGIYGGCEFIYAKGIDK
ncbi:hypothetical protein SAY86_030119 [Trapa natans]|uniref:Uncharacterized protein n=1 Tax=Trapa natans TaxID=22666 RepID=A0AAN7RI23_TRANT|nr:hypothetical protein SAY86_030119 [Trapa natans]